MNIYNFIQYEFPRIKVSLEEKIILPKIPKHLHRGTPKKMTDDMIEIGKSMLKEGHSERFIANKLNVSRGTLRLHCKEGWRKRYYKLYKNWDYIKNHNNLEKKSENSLRRYHILNSIDKESMSKLQAQYRLKRNSYANK
jgi:hypothetical protein